MQLGSSLDFPSANALQGPGGEQDIFIVKINPQGTALLFSTYLGGSGREADSSLGERQGPALAVNPYETAGSVYVAGYTESVDFPTAAPLQGEKAGYVGAFVARIFDDPNDRADLAVTGLAPAEGDVGAYLFYSFLVTNHGPAEASGVTLTAQLSTGVNFDGPIFFNHASSGICTGEGGVVTCQLGALSAGASASVDMAITPTGPGMFVNTVSVSSNKSDDQPANNSVVKNTIVRDLSITEVGGAPQEIQVGDDTGYLLVVANNGPADVTNVRLIDQLPDGVTVKEARISGSFFPVRTCPYDSHVVVCQVDTMPAGATFTVGIIVTATTAGTLVNTATVQSNERDGNLANNSVETRRVVTRPTSDLSLALAASPNPVQLGGTVTYTIDVTNLGPSTAPDVILTDTLSGQESLVSASATVGSCTGTWVVTCSLGALSSGEQVRVTVRTTAIRIPDMARTFDNTAVVTTAAVDPNPANNTAGIVMNVNTAPIANAGPDQVVSVGASCQATVTLNGMASSDPEGDALTYTWTTENLLPPPIVLSSGGGSGGAVTGPMPTGSVPLGIFTILLTVSDGNGGTATDTVRIAVRDTTGPVFSNVPGPLVAEQSSPAGASVSLGLPTATDNCSGSVPVSSNAPVVFPPGTTTVTFTTADAAGNSATASTSVTVRDTIPPAIQILSPQARDYAHADVLAISFSTADAGSGLIGGSLAPSLDGVSVTNGQSIGLLTLALGDHAFTVSATDAAGNPIVRSVTFRIIATIDSLVATVNLFAQQQQIDDSRILNGLLGKLDEAKQAVARGKNTVAINKLNDLIAQVQAQVGQHITSYAGQVLVTDAQYVIATLR